MAMTRPAEAAWAAVPISPSMEKEFFTEAEYFDYEETAFGHWEWRPVPATVSGREGRGVIRAMSGGRPNHAEMAGKLIQALGGALRVAGNRFCHVYTSDLKVHCGDGLNTYPDVSVLCGRPSYHAGRRDIVTNPSLLCEVLSPSTEGNDRGAKWRSYQTIPTLQHYLLVSAAETRVEVFTRTDDGGWRVQVVEGLLAGFDLPALGVRVPMAELYDLVDLEAQD